MSNSKNSKSLLKVTRIPSFGIDKLRHLSKDEAKAICFDFPEDAGDTIVVADGVYAFVISWYDTGEVLAHVRGSFIWEELGGFFDLGHTFDESLNRRECDLADEVLSALFCEDLLDEKEFIYDLKEHKFVNKK